MAKEGFRVVVGSEPKFYPATEDKQAWATARLAEPTWNRGADGKIEEGETRWFDGQFFGRAAESFHETYSKGDRMVVLGRVDRETVEKDGGTYENVRLLVDAHGPDSAYMDVTATRRQNASQQQRQTPESSVAFAATGEPTQGRDLDMGKVADARANARAMMAAPGVPSAGNAQVEAEVDRFSESQQQQASAQAQYRY